MKAIIILSFSLLMFISSHGQQDPITSQYHLNSSMINPAYTGLYNRFIINANIRRQWNGLQGSPNTNILSVNTSVIENMVGAGLVIKQDEIGISTTTEANLLLSYQIELASNQIFSFGLQGGVTNIKHDQGELTLRYLDDPDFSQMEETSSAPNFGVGLALMSDYYLFNLSIPRLLNTEFKDGLTNSTIYKRHIYLSGAIIKDLTSLFKLKPHALLRYVEGAPFSFDLGASVLYNNQFWFGVFTRDLFTQGALVQFILKDAYRLGYAIEIPTAQHLEGRFLTHEIVLGIDLALFGNQDVYLRHF